MPEARSTRCAPEILAHCRRIGEHFDLYDDALLPDRGHRAALGRGRAALDRHDQPRRRASRARFVVMANGPLQPARSCRASPASRRFKGHTFHTSRWDYDYTGGDSQRQPRPRLADKRVGIIGTGATGDPVRAAPRRVRPSSSTCSSARRRRSTCATTARPIRSGRQSLAAGLAAASGWTTSTSSSAAATQDEDLVNDGWTDIIRKLLRRCRRPQAADVTPRSWREPMELADFEKMEEIRARVDAIVEDPATAEALKPWYRQFCKRPCFHDEYLPTFNRPNVTLVDTDGQGRRAASPSTASSSTASSTRSTA